MKNCVCCGNILRQGKCKWHFICPNCGYESGDLSEFINSSLLHSKINEEDREIGLENLRNRNFNRIIQLLIQHMDKGKKLLDVGCAHGWFLSIARNYYDVIGIEPDVEVAKKAIEKKLKIRIGFFPDTLLYGEKFDIIIFNDVIEHIPDVRKVLSACYEHLNNEGLLVLNIPVSQGVIYNISKIFCSIGITSFFKRMWQFGFPSPHLHYFNQKNLSMLVKSSNFKFLKSIDLKSISAKGLKQRIVHTNNFGMIFSILIYFSLLSLLPLFNLLKSDTSLFVYQK